MATLLVKLGSKAKQPEPEIEIEDYLVIDDDDDLDYISVICLSQNDILVFLLIKSVISLFI